MNDEQATEIVAPEAPIGESPEVKTESQLMDDIWERAQSEGIEDEEGQIETESQPRGEDGKFKAKEPEVEAETEAVAEEVEPETEVQEPIEGPTHVSAELRQMWKDIPETARELISNDHKTFSDRLAQQGRQMTAIQPIADQVVKAAQEIPSMKDMTPAQIANDVFEMAKIQGQMNADPVGTLMQVAQQFGALDGLKARFEGREVTDTAPAMASEMKQLRQENERFREQFSPENIGTMMNETLQQRETQGTIDQFAASRKHYAQVEEHLTSFIPVAQQILGEGASTQDILSRSYDMAINALGLKAEAPEPVVDPKQTERAIKAKSVNVKSTSTGKSKPLTERELMSSVYDKAMAR